MPNMAFTSQAKDMLKKSEPNHGRNVFQNMTCVIVPLPHPLAY